MYFRMEYYGQLGQDKFLDRSVFLGMQNGIFVDVGAHDGKHFSNTYFFEKERGWKGICIEPIPAVFNKCQELRKHSQCYQLAIDRDQGTKFFLVGKDECEMLSVLLEHLDPRHYSRIKNNELENIEVKTIPLQDLFDQNNIHHVNYLSIDVEGAEFVVLETIDFSKTTFDVIEVECNYVDLETKFDEFFLSKGFIRLLSLNWDLMYIHKYSFFLKEFKNETLPLELSIFQPPWKDWKQI